MAGPDIDAALRQLVAVAAHATGDCARRRDPLAHLSSDLLELTSTSHFSPHCALVVVCVASDLLAGNVQLVRPSLRNGVYVVVQLDGVAVHSGSDLPVVQRRDSRTRDRSGASEIQAYHRTASTCVPPLGPLNLDYFYGDPCDDTRIKHLQ